MSVSTFIRRDYITSEGRAQDNYKKDSTIQASHLFIRFGIRQETHNSSIGKAGLIFLFLFFFRFKAHSYNSCSVADLGEGARYFLVCDEFFDAFQ